MTCTSKTHVRYPIQLRYPDCCACEVHVAGGHAVDSTVGLDLRELSAVSEYVDKWATYVVELHAVKLEEAGERADLVDEARGELILRYYQEMGTGSTAPCAYRLHGHLPSTPALPVR